MALIHIAVESILWSQYNYNTDTYTHTPNPSFKPNTEDTYMMILGPNQHNRWDSIHEYIKSNNGKVVFKAPMAYNRNYRFDGPRNTLIVFEFE